jgi:hypothetical protein
MTTLFAPKHQSIIWVLILMIHFSCNSNNLGELMVLNNKKSKYSKHVVEGLWMIGPLGYNQAKNYNGFQNLNMTSSISVKVLDEPLYKVKNRFNEKNQKANKWEINEMNPVKINDLDSCFYIEYLDRRKQFEKFDLIVRNEKKSKTYYITAFKMIGDDRVNEKELKSSVLSAFLGMEEEKEELFKLANIDTKLNTTTYTKDGKYPTESPGNGVLEVSLKSFKNESQLESFMTSVIKKETNNENYYKDVRILSDSKFLVYDFKTNEKKYMYVVLFSEDEDSIVMKYTCGLNVDNSDFYAYAQANLMKLSFR